MDSDPAGSAELPCMLTGLFVIYPDRHTVRLIEGGPAPWPPREPFCPSVRNHPRMHRRAKPQPLPCRVRPKSAQPPDLRKPLQREMIRILSIIIYLKREREKERQKEWIADFLPENLISDLTVSYNAFFHYLNLQCVF